MTAGTTQPLLLAQGDILLRPVDDFRAARYMRTPPDPSGAVVLARGEKSGHAHVVEGKGVRLFRDLRASWGFPPGLYLGHLVVSRTAVLVHQEHAAIPLAAGTTYLVTRQREFSARAEREAILVAD